MKQIIFTLCPPLKTYLFLVQFLSYLLCLVKKKILVGMIALITTGVKPPVLLMEGYGGIATRVSSSQGQKVRGHLLVLLVMGS